MGGGCNLLGTFSSNEAPAKYLHSHRMRHVLSGIKEDGSFVHAPTDWSKSSANYHFTKDTYDAIPEIFDKNIYEEWHSLSRGGAAHVSPGFPVQSTSMQDFIEKYPTFESYKEDHVQKNTIENRND